MIDDLNIKLDINFEDFASVNAKFQNLIKQIQNNSNVKLNIDTEQMQKQVQQVNDQVKKMESNVSDGIGTKIQTESEKLAKVTEQMQRTLSISLQGMQTKYNSILPQEEVTKMSNAIKNLNGSDLSTLRTNAKDIRLDMAQMTANARDSSSALKLANTDAKSFISTFATDMVKFSINVLSPNMVTY